MGISWGLCGDYVGIVWGFHGDFVKVADTKGRRPKAGYSSMPLSLPCML